MPRAAVGVHDTLESRLSTLPQDKKIAEVVPADIEAWLDAVRARKLKQRSLPNLRASAVTPHPVGPRQGAPAPVREDGSGADGVHRRRTRQEGSGDLHPRGGWRISSPSRAPSQVDPLHGPAGRHGSLRRPPDRGDGPPVRHQGRRRTGGKTSTAAATSSASRPTSPRPATAACSPSSQI